MLDLIVSVGLLPLLYGLVFELTQADIVTGLMAGAAHAVLAGAALPLIAGAGKCTPAYAAGLFGWRLGRATPLVLLVTRVMYGAVLGYVYVVPAGG